MENGLHLNRTHLLKQYFFRWLETERLSQDSAVEEIRQASIRIGLDDVIQTIDRFFSHQGTLQSLTSNRSNFMRWIGHQENGEKICERKLWHIELAVVAAMPSEISTAYLNAVYGPANKKVVTNTHGEQMNILDALRLADKETSEARVAAIGLDEHCPEPNIISALQEIDEGVEALQALRATVCLIRKNRIG